MNGTSEIKAIEGEGLARGHSTRMRVVSATACAIKLLNEMKYDSLVRGDAQNIYYTVR